MWQPHSSTRHFEIFELENLSGFSLAKDNETHAETTDYLTGITVGHCNVVPNYHGPTV